MSRLAALGDGLHGAMLLARGSPDGMLMLAGRDEPPLTTAARSFWAAAICLPAFLCLQLLDMAQTAHPPRDPTHWLALQVLGYAIAYAGFALLTLMLARRMGREIAWPRYIAAWNWCNVVQALLQVAAALPGLLDLPDIVGDTALLVALGWALWLEWFAARLALGVSAAQAAGLVLLDLSLGNAMDVLSALLSGGTR